jgi:DNA polymerase III alpha subunit
MAFLSVEDKTGTAEVIVFPALFSNIQKLIEEKSIVIVIGTIDYDAAPACKIKAEMIQDPEKVYEELKQIKRINFNLGYDNVEQKIKLLDSLQKGIVPVEITLYHENKQIKVISKRKVTFTKKQLDLLRQEEILISIQL